MATVLQWNCRGLRPNYEEVQLLIQNYAPTVICLQEIKLKPNNNITFRNYVISQKCLDSEVAHGGVMILTSCRTPYSVIPLTTNLQAVAVRVSLPKAITFCSVYLPPNEPITLQELDDLFYQLPAPVVVAGDLNAHSTTWYCQDLNSRGKMIEDFINNQNLTVLNCSRPTYINATTGTGTVIDVILCDPALTLEFTCHTHDDTCGSDHFPNVIQSVTPVPGHGASRWKIDKADWASFVCLCERDLTTENILKHDDPVCEFTKALLSIANKTVPRTKPPTRRPSKPWFNQRCKEALRKRKRALKKFQKEPCQQNSITFKMLRAKARRTVREEKRSSWECFVAGLNASANAKKVWDAVRKIAGKYTPTPIKHLTINNNLITDANDICNALAVTLAQNSSDNHYSEIFKKHKYRKEAEPMSFKSSNDEYYNEPFSLRELTFALKQARDCCPGPDNIHNAFLRNLPERSVELLLQIMNKLYADESFPTAWCDSIVIPIPKPEKDHSDPNNYRPISLTSCLCKVFEKMINRRLIYYLESKGILASTQSGFRSQHSTTDHLTRLESWIREGQVNREHVVAVFFDLEKAYDTTWRHGIMIDLHRIGLRGHLPCIISKFLENRSFRVRHGNCMSEKYIQENGVPQGSVLSVTLFGLKINSIVDCLVPDVNNSLFVDDFGICCRSKSMRSVERKLQQCLNNLEKWTVENGFKFSETKTVCVHFCNQRKVHDDPQLTLNNKAIRVEKQAKFLGVLFDNKGSYIPHLKSVRAKCSRNLNLLRVVSCNRWGSDSETLLKLYRSLIRSKLDYGCIAYGAARKTYLNILEPIQNQALRICLGAFRTSPVESLLVEANEPPLALRREKLAVQYACKLKSIPTHPTSVDTFSLQYSNVFDRRKNQIPSFGIRVVKLASEINIDFNVIAHSRLPAIPTWLMRVPNVNLSLHDIPKAYRTPEFHRMLYFEYTLTKQGYIFLFTDGSKGDGVASAAVVGKDIISCRISDDASIFTAEAHAILLALHFVERSSNSKFIIFSDSFSCLQAISSMKWQNPIILDILEVFSELTNKQNDIRFCWIPSHMGIKGNERADSAAKNALLRPLDTKILVPYNDIKCKINMYFKDRFQNFWNNAQFNKLRNIKPHIGKTILRNICNRRDESVLHRARIGHTYITHGFLLRREDAPECQTCQCLLTVEHILINCKSYHDIRQRFYSVGSLSELFNRVAPVAVVNFLKQINLYDKF